MGNFLVATVTAMTPIEEPSSHKLCGAAKNKLKKKKKKTSQVIFMSSQAENHCFRG